MESHDLADWNNSSSSESTEAVSNSEAPLQLQSEEVIRIEIFEEIPTIHRETFVREKVQIRKVLTQETANPLE